MDDDDHIYIFNYNNSGYNPRLITLTYITDFGHSDKSISFIESIYSDLKNYDINFMWKLFLKILHYLNGVN